MPLTPLEGKINGRYPRGVRPVHNVCCSAAWSPESWVRISLAAFV